MKASNFELFESFDYINNDELEYLLSYANKMYDINFKGFTGTSFGTNKKDVLAFCISYNFVRENTDINNLILAITSYQEEFFQDCLIHLHNMGCIKEENLLSLLKDKVSLFNNHINKKEYKLIEISEWLNNFKNDFEITNRNLDTEKSKYINYFNNIDKRILNLSLEKKLSEKPKNKKVKI